MIKLTDILNEDCWKDYKQVGLKKKNGKMVPNCVPESVVKEDESVNEAIPPPNSKKVEALKKAVQKINRKYKVQVSKIGPTKGEVEIELGSGNHPDNDYNTIDKLVKKLGIKHYSVFNESINETVDKDDLKNAKFRLKKVLKYLDIEYKKTRRGEKYVQINYIPITRPQSQNPEFVNVRYEDETDLQNIGKALKLKLKESVSEVAERDYKDEYKKFQSSTKSKKYRAELNKYNRDKGTYGNGDNKDASHKGGKIVGFESEKKNRGRAEKSRLKKND